MYASTDLVPLFSQLSLQSHSTLTSPTSGSTTPTLQHNVDKFLKDTEVQLHLGTIRAFLGPLTQQVELVGHELYKLFDKTIFDAALQAQDEAVHREFLHAHSQPITSCTVRFHIQRGQDLYTLVTQLQKSLFPNATTPFRPHPTNMLTGFALDGIHYVFCIDLARHYFATIDSVRLDITSGSPTIIDDGMFSTWTEDTVTKTIRIPQLERCFGSKHLCTLIAQGYEPLPDAYTLIRNEYPQKGVPLNTLIEKLAGDYQDKDEAKAFFTLVVFRASEALGQNLPLSGSNGDKICSHLLRLAHENSLSFAQLQALLCILGPVIPAHTACTKEAVSYQVRIDNHALWHRVPYVQNSTEEHFCSIPPHVFTSRAFIQLCARITNTAPPASPVSLPTDKNLLKNIFLASFIHAQGRNPGQIAEILTCFSSCYYQLAPPIKQLLVHILQHTVQIPYEPNGAQNEDEFIEEFLAQLIPHNNLQVSSWAKQLLVQCTGHTSFKEKYISAQDIHLSLRLMKQLQDTVSLQVVASCCEQMFVLKQLVDTCPDLSRRLYSVLSTDKKQQLLQAYAPATPPDDIVGDFISVLVTELQQKTAACLHVEWLCTLPTHIKPFERIQILMHSCLQFPEFVINKQLIEPLSSQLQTADKEQLKPLYTEIEQKKRAQAPLFVSCVPPKTPGEQVALLLVNKPTQKQRAEWRKTLLTLLEQGVSYRGWKKAFEKCTEWLEHDVISDMILVAFRNRDKCKTPSDVHVWREIFQHPDWLRSQHMVMLKEASYFLGLFPHEPPCQDFQSTLFTKLLRHVKEHPNQLQEYVCACVQWFLAIDSKYPHKNSLGYELFSLLCLGKSDLITKQAHILLQVLKPYFLTFQNKRTAQKRTRLNILDSLTQHVKAIKRSISQKDAVDMLVELIQFLHSFEDDVTDDILLTALSGFKHVKVLSALFETWARISLRPLLTTTMVSCRKTLTDRILKEGNLATLQRLFAFYFLRDGCPSEKPMYKNMHQKTNAPEEVQELYRRMAPGYKRMLQETLQSPSLDLVKNSLNIAFAILFSSITPAPQLLAQPIKNHFDLTVALFLRAYAQEGFTDSVNLFFEHLLSHAVDDKIYDRLKEQIEFTTMPVCHKGFYQYWLLCNESSSGEVEETIVARSYIVSDTGPTESEKAFILFLHTLIREALRLAGQPLFASSQRARLLDLVVSHIRTLIETYPTAPGIDEMIQNLKMSVQSTDPRWWPEAHTTIVDMLEMMRCPAKRGQDTKFLPEMQQKIMQYIQTPTSCTEETILELQHTIFNWVQRHTITSFQELFSCIRSLLELIAAKNLVDNPKIQDMMFTLLIPHLKCFGIDQGEAGQLYALNANTAYCHLLSKTAPFHAIDFALGTYLGGAFEKNYEGFSLLAQAVLLASLKNIAQSHQSNEVLSRLAALVSLPVKIAADRRRKNALVAELLQYEALSDKQRLLVVEALIDHRAPQDFEDADGALAILLLCCLMTQQPGVGNPLIVRLMSQIGHLQLQIASDLRSTVRNEPKKP